MITMRPKIKKELSPYDIVGFSEPKPDDAVIRTLVLYFWSYCYHKEIHFTVLLLVNFIGIFYYFILLQPFMKTINMLKKLMSHYI